MNWGVPSPVRPIDDRLGQQPEGDELDASNDHEGAQKKQRTARDPLPEQPADRQVGDDAEPDEAHHHPEEAEQMKRALVNLVDNAAEALEQSLQREIWVRTTLDAEREIVEVVVADSGPGIPPEAKERLFLPYFSTKQGGTGLGLAIVSRIVSDHHGTIRVEENQPMGTKFVIELPVERTSPVSAE